MNVVLLCKSRNHAKAVDLLNACVEEDLHVNGIVALATPETSVSIKEAIRKLHERLARRKPTAAPVRLSSSNAPSSLPNGNFFSVEERNGQTAFSQAKPVSQSFTLAAYARQNKIPIKMAGALNDQECEHALRSFAPAVVLLGGVPLVRENILAIPKIGVLNVHMGWLPGVRGMNAAEWSIFNDRPVAVSVHFVDAGVDTGAILYREKFDVSHYDQLAEMRRQLSAFQHRVLARAARLLLEQRLQPIPQKPEEGKQYYVMHPRLRTLVEMKLRAGFHAILE